MNATLALLVLAALPGAEPSLSNLDFSAKRLTHWEGQGFTLTAGGDATSADQGPAGRTAILHRTFFIPANATHIHFTAAAVRPAGAGPVFGLNGRQSQRFAADDAPVPPLVAKVIGLLLAGKLTIEDLKALA